MGFSMKIISLMKAYLFCLTQIIYFFKDNY